MRGGRPGAWRVVGPYCVNPVVNVSHQDAGRIELEHLPTQWVVGLGAVCLVLVIGLVRALIEGATEGALVALAMLAALSWILVTRVFRRVRLSADRGTGQLRISAGTLLGEWEETYPLADLLRVEVDTRYEESTSAPRPSLALVLKEAGETRRVRLDLFRPRPEDLLSSSERVNAWLGKDAGAGRRARAAGGSGS